MAPQGTEFLDPRLYIVAGDTLTGTNAGEVDLFFYTFVGSDRIGWDLDTQLALRRLSARPDSVVGGEAFPPAAVLNPLRP